MEYTEDLTYLRLLSKQYPTIQAAATEIINLSALLDLPKGTEHFLSDIHGEYQAFLHVLKNGSGSIKRKIDDLFANNLTEAERRRLATLIYYPEQKLPLILREIADHEEWYRLTLFRLVQLCRVVASKYTRADVQAALPDDFASIIQELLHEQESIANKVAYYQSIIDSIIATGSARAFIIAMSNLIQRLAIARLHIIGDIYDRGPGAHIIMDALMEYHAVDIQWGNHDIVWMGAAAGSDACIANVIRLALRYANMDTLENGYAVSLLPLASLAMEVYGKDRCKLFRPKAAKGTAFTDNEMRLMARMHKAITVIQFKLEAQIVMRRPQYQMEDRLLLDKIDYSRGMLCLNGREYPLRDTHFPTIDPENPYELTRQEQTVVERLRLSFANSEKLQKHVRFLFSKGSMYLVHNENLLYHGCIAMHKDGSFMAFTVGGESFRGKAFMDRADRLARQGYFSADPEQKQEGLDTLWYLWSGAQSPLFGKHKMATFERYLLSDKKLQREKMNPYYNLRYKQATAEKILLEFGLDPGTAHIINGHVPVKVSQGESPIKANGKLLVIDGGLSRAYQKQTGIAGYTLIYNSYGLLLAAHDPFESTEKAIEDEMDIHSKTEILETNQSRIRVRDIDQGREIQQRIAELRNLLSAYRAGLIKEK